MPSSVIVNFLTTQHKVSVGTTLAFPDVCKTPAPPAPAPVPIPYPNVGQSMMAAVKVTKRVSDDTGQKVMLMQSSYTMTSGDEPGVALGIISNRVKGKSTTQNSSFNVKFEGKGVSRLMDPHGDNAGSGPPNAFTPAEMQGPMVGIDTTALAESKREACDKLEEKRVPKTPPDKPGSHAEVAKQAGMREEDYSAMRKVCAERKVCVSFRDTNPECIRHMAKGSKSKGHDVLTKTFEKGSLPKGEKDLAGLVSVLEKKPKGPLFRNGKLTKKAANCIAKDKKGRPVVDPDKVTKAEDLLYKDKHGNPLTGDYDMNDIFDAEGKRIRGGPEERKLQHRFNKAMGRPARVKHGAQANFQDFVRSRSGKHEMKELKKANKPFPKGLMQAGIDPGKGEGLTVFDGTRKPPKEGRVYRLETPEDVINMYRCKGQPVPESWRYRDEKGRFTKV